MSAFAYSISVDVDPPKVAVVVAAISDPILAYSKAAIVACWTGDAFVRFWGGGGIFALKLGMLIDHPLASVETPVLPSIRQIFWALTGSLRKGISHVRS